MAFPSIRSTATTAIGTATTTPAVNLPTGANAPLQNDVIVVLYRCAVAGAIAGPDASWNELKDESADAADDQNWIAWRRATGSEAATITLTTGNGKGAGLCFVIQDAADPVLTAPEINTVATGTTGNPDSGSLTPAAGAKDYLWLSLMAMEGEPTGVTGYPTNYGLSQITDTSGTAGAVTTNVRVAGAGRQLNGTSDNPGNFTITGTSDDWSAYTLAFSPPPADPTPGYARTYSPRTVTRALAAAAAIVAFVPVLEAPVPDVSGWGPKPPRLVPGRPLTTISPIVQPWSNQPGGTADASPTATAGQLSRPLTVQYTPFGGPVIVSPELSWLSFAPMPPARFIKVTERVVAEPFTAAQQQETSIGWWPYAQAPVLQTKSVRSERAIPPSETASAAQNVTWWPGFPDRIVRRVRFQAPFTADPPSAPTLPSAADAIATLTGPQLWPRGVVQYLALAGPVVVPAEADLGRPLPYNDDGLIRPDRYTHHQGVAGPVAIVIDVGWWSQPPRIIQARRRALEPYTANPIQPLDAAGRSDLPWLYPSQPLVRRKIEGRSALVLPVTVPGDQLTDIPWIVQPRLVTRRFARYEAFYAKPVQPTDADGRSDLPWLPEFPVLLRAERSLASVLASPLRDPDAVIWWNPRTPEVVRRLVDVESVIVVPSITTASATQEIRWWPKFPDRLVLRIREEPSRKVDPPTIFAVELAATFGPAQTTAVLLDRISRRLTFGTLREIELDGVRYLIWNEAD